MMKKAMKKFLTVLSIVLIICILEVLFNAIFMSGILFMPHNSKDAEKTFEKTREEMYAVSEYFSESEYDSIYIPDSFGSDKMSVGGKLIDISDEEAVQSIKKLMRRGCDVIGKENNTVYFQMWSTLDKGSGFVYSIDGDAPQMQFLTKLEVMSEAGWYYYEEDFNEWKLKNK